MTSWHSYPKIYNVGHPAVDDLFHDEVIVEEKVDGSQLSFGRFGVNLRIRSKGRVFDIEAPDNLFEQAAATVKQIGPNLTDGWTYRCEYLKKPKHNSLAYDRIPNQHLIVFDICTGEERYLPYAEKVIEAQRLGLETVPILAQKKINSAEEVFDFLKLVSVLGGQLIEGVVIKNYNRFTRDGKAMLGKHVSEVFKEVHSGEWKKKNPTQKDVVSMTVDEFRTPAMWNKAIQHLRDKGELTNSPRDIGPLLKEIHRDIDTEAKEEILARLWARFRKDIMRGVVRGFPDYYKEHLLKIQFED